MSASSSTAKKQNCSGCGTAFSIFKKKHLCESCNCLQCSACNTCLHQLLIPKLGHTKPVTVCTQCFITVCVDQRDHATLARVSLQQLKIYAQKKQVNLRHCIERADIVGAIIAASIPSPSPSSPSSPSPVPSSSSSYSSSPVTSPPSSPPSTASSPSPSPSFNTHVNNNVTPNPADNNNLTRNNYSSNNNRDTSYSYSPNSNSNNSSNNNNNNNDVREGELEKMSVSQLKLILLNHAVDYSKCVEKQELVNLVIAKCPHVLGAKNKEEMFEVPQDDQCIICMDRRIDTVLLECGHLCCCIICSKHLRECPVCRKHITRIVQTYHANK